MSDSDKVVARITVTASEVEIIEIFAVHESHWKSPISMAVLWKNVLHAMERAVNRSLSEEK